MSQKHTYEPLDELRYKRISSARISPNGKWVVYDLTENDLDKDIITSSVWRVNLETGETSRLTQGTSRDSTPEWSPDGTQIAFFSDRDGKKQVYLLPSEGGEARKLTNFEQGVARGPAWSPDGRTIAYTVGPMPRDPKKPYRVTRPVYRFDGLGIVDDVVQNIYIQPVDGGEPKQLTNDRQMNHNMRWSPDGKEILYLASHDPEKPNLFSAKVRVVNLDGEVEELVELERGLFVNANWSTDGKRVLFAGATGEFPMGSKFDLWVMNRDGSGLENRTEALKWGINYEWISARNEKVLSEDDDIAWVNVTKQGAVEIYAVTLTGEQKFTPLVGGQRTLSLRDASDQHLLYISSTIENIGELFICNLDGTGEKQITNVNRQLISEIAFPKVDYIHFKSEGVDVDGWLLTPVNGTAPYPTILYIHGGPHGWYGFGWGFDFQVLAGAGYAVLYTNPRGSKGYGDEFSTALSGNWGVMDYKDLMAGVDYVVEQGIADPDRLGVAGLSYGGFMTTFTVGQTRRFKAAVAENPITDLVSRYGTADMGPWGSISELGGKPHEIPDVYKRSSPITYAHTCTTPTLLVQGEADYRCPIGQSEQFYSHLKANGCITEMVRYPEMSHLGSITGPLEVQKSQNDELLGWMNKYVLGKE